MERWIAACANSASADIGVAVEDLLESDFVRVGTQYARIVAQVRQIGFTSMPLLTPHACEAYTSRLTVVIDYLEASTGQSIGEFTETDWHNEVYAIGHARMPAGPAQH